MRPTVVLLASAALLLLAVPVHAAPAAPASDCAPDIPCGTINLVCQKVVKTDCVAQHSASSTEECALSACTTVNVVCQRLFDTDCVAVGSARLGPSCMGEVCDAINAVCDIVLGTPSCVG